jgi:hypothetical protein
LPLAGQGPFDRYHPNVPFAIIQSGRVILKRGNIKALAPEEPVIAEHIPAALLDTPAPVPRGATIRQVLSNTADGTPGEEVLDNRSFFDALRPIAGYPRLPSVMQFAAESHGTLGWFVQEYGNQQLLWCYGPSALVVRIPNMNLTLVVSGNLAAARLEDGNVLRSVAALLFLQDVAKLSHSGADNLIDEALDSLYVGQRAAAVTLAREALMRFPELESTPDVTLLYLFAQLRLPETEASATAVLRAHPSLPTAWFYYGQYLENSKRYREAAVCFEKITMHEPPWHNWTVAAAQRELPFLKTY